MQPGNTVSKPTSSGLSARGAACVIWFRNLHPGDCLPGVQPLFTVFQPTSWGLFARDAACIYNFQTYLQATVRQGYSLLYVSQTTSRGLLVRVAVCLYSFQTYLQGTVDQWCSLFNQFLNLPLGHRQPGVKHFYAVSEPTSIGPSAKGAACLYGFRIYFQWTVGQGCSLFIQFQNLPPRNGQLVVQPVYKDSKPTFRGLLARGAACLYGF